MFIFISRNSRRRRPALSSSSARHHLSSSAANTTSSSNLCDKNSFKPPLSLHKNSNPNPDKTSTTTKKAKPPYRPPSSLDRDGNMESDPAVRPIGLREPKYSTFGQNRLDRVWTGVCAPAVDPRVGSVEDGKEDPKLEEKRSNMRERILGEPLTSAERKALVDRCQRNTDKRQINLGRDGLTHNKLNDIHNHWKHSEAVRIECTGVPTVDMKRVCTQLEDKTFGKIINRQGGVLVLYRGRNYNPKQRPAIPLMLWKHQDSVYPRLVKTTIDGLSIEDTKEMRKKGLAAPPLTKLAKNGYYGSLVPMVQDTFLARELVRIDCQGLEKSDYKKVGYKLRDLVPCVLVTFDKEQIVVWRGKDYKPIEADQFFMGHNPFDNPDNDLFSGPEEENSDDESSQHGFHSGNK